MDVQIVSSGKHMTKKQLEMDKSSSSISRAIGEGLLAIGCGSHEEVARGQSPTNIQNFSLIKIKYAHLTVPFPYLTCFNCMFVHVAYSKLVL